MPRIRTEDSTLTKPMPRVPDPAARTVPIPNLAADNTDVIANAVRDAAASAMTMPMPAIQPGVAAGAPTEPLPVLRETRDDDEPSGGDAPEPRPAPSTELVKPAILAEAGTVSFRRMSSGELVLPDTVAEVVAVVDAASKAIAAAEDAARQVAAAHSAAPAEVLPPPVLDLRQPAQPAPVDGLLDLLAPVVDRPLMEVERPQLPAASDLMALHRAEFELEFVEPPVVAAGDEPPIPARFGPGLAVLPHIEFPV